MSELTKQGIMAVKAGDKQRAKHILNLAIQSDPKDIDAWLWLSGAVDTNEERIECLQAILRLDPNNQLAARGLAQLVSQGAVNLQPVTIRNIAAPQLYPQPTPITQNINIAYQEEIIFKDHPSWGFMFVGLGTIVLLFGFVFYSFKLMFRGDSSGLFFSLFACPLGVAFVFLAIRIVALWATSRYTLTNRKLIVEKGLFTHQRKVIPIEKIQDVGYHREFIQIILGVGDVVVESAGERGQVRLRHLRKYRERSDTILSLIQKQ